MKTKKIFNLVKDIKKKSEDEESYGTGLVGEKLIIASYKTMTIDKLEKLRFIMNKIIREKKQQRAISIKSNNNVQPEN
jgi:hypothetical protein